MTTNLDCQKSSENQKPLPNFYLTEVQCSKTVLSFQIRGTQLSKRVEGQKEAMALDLSQSVLLEDCFAQQHLENSPEHFRGILTISPAESIEVLGHESRDILKFREQSAKYRLIATGTFKAFLQPLLECVRCLTEFRAQIEVEESFKLIKNLNDRELSIGKDSELEIESEAFDCFELVHGRISLDSMIHDFVSASLPDYPLCNVSCLGLCASCGSNMNSPRSCDRTDCSKVAVVSSEEMTL